MTLDFMSYIDEGKVIFGTVFEAMVQAARGRGVVSGCNVSSSLTSLAVIVNSGIISFNGVYYNVEGKTLSLQPADATKDRLDVVVWDKDSGLMVLTGDEWLYDSSGNYIPKTVRISDTQVPLAVVKVPAGGTVVSEVYDVRCSVYEKIVNKTKFYIPEGETVQVKDGEMLEYHLPLNGAILDNSGGGYWNRAIRMSVRGATQDAQYMIKIDGDNIYVYNSIGNLKVSGGCAGFWNYVNSTGVDIRIMNQSSQLYFWIQDFNTTTKTATIWVNLTAGSTALEIYYGNPDAAPSTYNNGSKVFKFFDDFTGTALDSKWTVENAYGTYSVTVSNSVLTLYANAGSVAVNATFTIDFPAIVISRVKDVNAGFSTYVRDRYLSSNINNPFAADSVIATSAGVYYLYWQGAWTTIVPKTDTWVISKEIFVPGSKFEWIRPTFDVSTATALTALNLKYGVGDYGATTGSGEIQFDWIFVADIVDPATFGYPVTLSILDTIKYVYGDGKMFGDGVFWGYRL